MRERNSKTAPMGGEISAGDLLTMRKLEKTASHLHIDERNIRNIYIKCAKNEGLQEVFIDLETPS